MKKREIFKESFGKRKERKIVLFKTVFLFVLVIILFIGLSRLLRIPSINIKEIKIEGNHVLLSEDLVNKTNEYLKGSYFYFFPKTSVFFVNKKGVGEILSVEFKRIQYINVSLRGNTLIINISERQATYLWCGTTIKEELVAGELKCYFLDDKGYVFSTAPYFSGNVYVKIYGGAVPSDTDPLGQNILKDDMFIKLVQFFEALRSINIDTFALLIKQKNEYEIYLDDPIRNKNAPKLMFKGSSDFDKLVSNLNSALKTSPLLEEFENNFSRLLYLDLRFDNKVYYKFSTGVTEF